MTGLQLAALAVLIMFFVGSRAGGAERELRVCADPNNLPFSNEREEGFENRIAELVADELDAELSYTWWAQRRGFIRSTLGAGACDLVIGVPAGYELAETTDAYYRSAYVYVYRADRGLELHSMRDPRLRHLRIGVHLIGDDGVNPPPAHALGEQGIVDNVVGYMIYGDYRETESAGADRRGGRDRRTRRRRGLGTDRRVFRQACLGPAQRGADHGYGGLCPSALRVRHRHGGAQRRACLPRRAESHSGTPPGGHPSAARRVRGAAGAGRGGRSADAPGGAAAGQVTE